MAGSIAGALMSGGGGAPAPSPVPLQVLVVAGGGGGAFWNNAVCNFQIIGWGGGGGGAGGVISTTSTATPGISYIVTVGGGGTGSATDNGPGIDSSAFSITSTGGGRGGRPSFCLAPWNNGCNGGSGGGMAYCIFSGNPPRPMTSCSGTGIAGQGNPGSNSSPSCVQPGGFIGMGAGGGGAGGAGEAAGRTGPGGFYPANKVVCGGPGTTGFNGITYGGGGNSSAQGCLPGYPMATIPNQPGGGGAGASVGIVYLNPGFNSCPIHRPIPFGCPGQVNTGGGGGASMFLGNRYLTGPSYPLYCGGCQSVAGGAGGSGIVVIQYPDSFPAATTTGSPTVVVSGGSRTYCFTGSGTIQFS